MIHILAQIAASGAILVARPNLANLSYQVNDGDSDFNGQTAFASNGYTFASDGDLLENNPRGEINPSTDWLLAAFKEPGVGSGFEVEFVKVSEPADSRINVSGTFGAGVWQDLSTDKSFNMGFGGAVSGDETFNLEVDVTIRRKDLAASVTRRFNVTLVITSLN